ncbi:ABC transporter permease [Caproiciproducens faecalis]|uniref:Iron ABC transporter permease n=1 Tax=Caproiciproducens faecalis TaxID=2820301 RepID=A0ABS7DNS7_9FIRM|nr:iron ABC transporter permease [Caproiciproducens faecalis]MBW7572970.1 iron ABC transporter permease [Caproiciproducens faecalis]
MDTTKKRLGFWSFVSFGIMALILLFLVYPIFGLMKEAFFTQGSGFTLDAFQKFFSKNYYYQTIGNSFQVSLAVTVISLLLGIPFSYFYTFFQLKGKKLLFVLCLLCTLSAPFIGAYSWILLMGNSGLVTNFLKTFGITGISIYGFGGIVLVQTLKLFPLVVIYMNGAFRDIDNSLMEVAESMGCKGVKRFFKVLMTLTMPTILAAALLVFMRAFADFGTPALIGQGFQTFPVLIYNEYLSENGADFHFAAAISFIAIIVTGVIFLIQKFATNKFSFTMSALHPIEPKEAKGAGGFLMHAFCYLLVAIALVPQIYIINMSFRNYNNSILRPGYSLVNYQKAIQKMLYRSIGNTIVISVVTLAIIIVVAILIAYLVVRKGNVFNNAIDTISMLPYIMPGAVIGISLVIAFNKSPFVLNGTLAIMIIALVIRRMPFTSRSATAAMMKIPESIEEAAVSLGASKLKTLVRITVPMMSSGVISGAVLSWVSIITEMSSGVILYNNKTITLTVSTYNAIVRGTFGVAAVFAAVTTVFTVVCLFIYLKFTKIEDVKL